MRFVLAIVSFVIGVVLVGLGVGQRTVFAPPSSIDAKVAVSTAAPVTVIPGNALIANAGHQRIRISGGGTAFAAYGRTADVNAWVGKTRHQTLRYDADTQALTSKVSGTAASAPNPKGSDLWYQEFSGSSLDFTVELPSDVSLVIVSDGTAAAPPDVSVTWPRDTSTPLVGPLMTAGGFFVALGIALYVWAVLHQRKLRGPRRRSGGTRPPRARRGSRRAAAGVGAQVPVRSRRRRMVAALPVVIGTALVLTGCSPQYWPHASDATASATPSATSTGAAVTAQPVAATAKQIDRIIARVSEVATAADAARDSTAIATRFTGPALAARTANYTIRGADSTVQAPPAIPSHVSVALPQQTDSWPRTIFAVVQDPTKTDVAPQALTLVQASARDEYQVEYDVSLEDVQFPRLAPVSIGAAQLSPDVKLLTLQPGQVATAYSDILANDTASQYADAFDATGDELRTKIGKAYKDQKAASLPTTAKIAYTSDVPDDTTVALATNSAGALVSADLDEIETVTPTASGAEVNTEGAVKALSGVSTSTKGITATYGVQVLFYVPPVGAKAKIELLGFSQGLIAASEVQ